jgi:hypothetical protein
MRLDDHGRWACFVARCPHRSIAALSAQSLQSLLQMGDHVGEWNSQSPGCQVIACKIDGCLLHSPSGGHAGDFHSRPPRAGIACMLQPLLPRTHIVAESLQAGKLQLPKQSRLPSKCTCNLKHLAAARVDRSDETSQQAATGFCHPTATLHATHPSSPSARSCMPSWIVHLPTTYGRTVTCLQTTKTLMQILHLMLHTLFILI